MATTYGRCRGGRATDATFDVVAASAINDGVGRDDRHKGRDADKDGASDELPASER